MYLLCLWGQPILISDALHWFTLATPRHFHTNELEQKLIKLQALPLLQRGKPGQLSFTGFSHSRFASRISRDIVEYVSGNHTTSLLNSIAIAHARWPDDVKRRIESNLLSRPLDILIDPRNARTSFNELIKSSLESSKNQSIFSAANHLFIYRAADDGIIDWDLSNISLEGCDFRGALLFNCDLRNSNLSQASFSDVNGPIYTVAVDPNDEERVADRERKRDK